MTEMEGQPGGFEWWWDKTKSERAARLVERYWSPINGDRSMVLMPEHKAASGLTNAKNQVRATKKAVERLGYRMFWRLKDGNIIAWVSPISSTAVRPPHAAPAKKPKAPKVDKPPLDG